MLPENPYQTPNTEPESSIAVSERTAPPAINAGWRDNLFQATFALVGALLGATLAVILTMLNPPWNLPLILAIIGGAVLGVIAGTFISGFILMLFGSVGHKRNQKT